MQGGAKILGVVLLASVVCTVYTVFKSYPVSDLVDPIKMQEDTNSGIGGMVGFSLAWYLEPRCIGFSTEGLSAKLRTERCVIGVVLALATYYARKPLGTVLETRLAGFIAYVALYLVSMLLVPFVFTKIEKALER